MRSPPCGVFTAPTSGIVLLQLLQLRDLLQMPEEELPFLLGPNVARCLVDGLVTVNERHSCARAYCEHILSNSGMALLSGKLFSFSQVQQLPLGVVKLVTSSDAVVATQHHA